jgi:dienelactone hydrolase
MQPILRNLIAATIVLAFVGSAVGAGNAATQSIGVSSQETRDALLKMIDRPKVDLAAEVDTTIDVGDLKQMHFTYASEARVRVPGLVLAKPEILSDGKRHPVVIVMHGTGGSKTAELDRLKVFAHAGFVAVAIDGRFHGERGTLKDYNAAIAKAYVDGKSHPLYFDTVWDAMRLMDYLQTRPEVDSKKIGLMGLSKGGIETWLTAAIDPRVAVAVPCISAQSFAWGLANDRWHHRIGTVQAGFDLAAKSEGLEKPDAAFVKKFYDRLIPGIDGQFDCPQMLPLIAPRPLLVISGEKDPINPIEGVRLCEQSATKAYTDAGAADRFKLLVEPGAAHAVTKEADAEAVAWFEKWLMN